MKKYQHRLTLLQESKFVISVLLRTIWEILYYSFYKLFIPIQSTS